MESQYIFNILTGLMGIIAIIISFYAYKKSKRAQSCVYIDSCNASKIEKNG